jgi:hypothetical protein
MDEPSNGVNMRLLIVSLCIFLVLSACAPAAATPAEPTPVPIESTSAPAESEPPSPEPADKASLQNSLLATEWRGDAEGNLLFAMDPATGTALPDYTPISLGQTFFHAFSPDQHTLAVISFPTQNSYNGSLLLVDLPAWKTQRFELGLTGWVNSMVFSPYGKRLAIASGQSHHQITMVDVEKGVITAQRPTDSSMVTRLKFTKNGEAVMSYGPMVRNRFTENEMSAGPPQIFLLDAADLTPLWSVELTEIRDGIFPRDENVTPENIHEPGQAFYLNPGLAFAPDRDALYIIHADSEKLTTVDFERQSVETAEIQTELTWIERLLSLTAGVAHAKIGDGTVRQVAVSPDGQFLYVTGVNSTTFVDKQGNWQMEHSPLGLEIIQSRDGKRVAHVETDTTELSLSPDGRFLYLRSWGNYQDQLPWTEIVETSGFQQITRRNNVAASPALRMNGDFLLVSTFSTSEYSHHMSILTPDGSSVLAEWTASQYLWWLTPP